VSSRQESPRRATQPYRGSPPQTLRRPWRPWSITGL
jgi:hypothetical protein